MAAVVQVRSAARAVTAGALVVGLLPGLGTAAPGVVPEWPEVEQVPRVDVGPAGGGVGTVALTDDFVHLGADRDAGSAIFSRALTPTEGGWLVGNPELVGSSPYGSFVAASDAIAWEDPWTADLVVRRDDRSVLRDAAGTYFPTSFSGDWHTSYGATLTPVPYVDGSEIHLGDLTGDARVTPPWAPGPADDAEPYLGWVSGTAVVWDEQWSQGYPWGAERGSGRALYARAMTPDGPAGETFALDALWGDDGDVVDVAVSDDWVVWLVRSTTGLDDVVRFVPTDDLGAVPQERAVGLVVQQVAVDGDRIAVTGYVVDTDWGVVQVSSLTEATAPRTVEAGFDSLADVDLSGDLLVVAGSHMSGVHGGALLMDLGGGTVAAVPGFPDVPAANPLLHHVDWLVRAGITTGYDDGTFRPYAPVTRQAMAAFLHRSAGSPAWTPPAVSPFADVAPGSPFYAEITWLHALGITEGYDGPGEDVLFRPAAAVSRQAMAAFLHRFADPVAWDPSAVSPFVDVPTSSEFYAEIAWLADAGISTGTDLGGGRSEFRPTAPVSRQAMAAFLHRLDGVRSAG